MNLANTQNDFHNNLKHYLDLVNGSNKTILYCQKKKVRCSIVDKNKLDQLERYTKANPESAEYDIAEDKLKEYGEIPDDDPKLKDEDY